MGLKRCQYLTYQLPSVHSKNFGFICLNYKKLEGDKMKNYQLKPFRGARGSTNVFLAFQVAFLIGNSGESKRNIIDAITFSRKAKYSFATGARNRKTQCDNCLMGCQYHLYWHALGSIKKIPNKWSKYLMVRNITPRKYLSPTKGFCKTMV